jgi:hypothetical protein
MPTQKWLFSPISVLGENIYPRNINHMRVEDSEVLIGAVKICARLELNENISFLDGHHIIRKENAIR